MNDFVDVQGVKVRPEGVLGTNGFVLHHVVGEDGLSDKERNLLLTHDIERFALVEVEDSGLRLYVALQGRDCDGTLLYWLTADKHTFKYTNEELMTWNPHCEYGLSHAKIKMEGGYPQYSLTVIRPASDLIADMCSDGWTDDKGNWIDPR